MRTSKMTKITCPYCNLEMNYLFTTVTPEFFVTTCEKEETDEGCGKKFVIGADWKPVVTVYKMDEVAK